MHINSILNILLFVW